MNDLVAPVQDSTTWSTGLWMVEDFRQLKDDIESGSWVDATIGGLSAGLDMLSVAVDPLGSLISMAVSWLMEHIQPLKEALDELTGNADEVRACADTWTNVSSAILQAASDLDTAVGADLGAWQGPASDSYRDNISGNIEGIGGLAGVAEVMASATSSAGVLVAAVRDIVRELIAECVGSIFSKLPRWLLEAATLIGIPAVVAEAAILIGKWIDRILTFLDALQLSLEALNLLVSA